MTELVQEVTAEEVARSYSAAMDSVALLQAGKPQEMADSEWADCKQRNIDHLKIQLEKGADFYGDLDLTPFEDAIK
jgi:hypothetical protein